MNQRIIKFRAWWKDAEIMEEVVTLRNGEISILVTLEPNSLGQKYEHQTLDEGQYDLMQFTGLHDKNGVPIYEGDLMQKEDATTPRVVKWTDQNGAYFVLSNSVKEKVVWDDCLTEDRIQTFGYEIVGNVYENPELLK